MNSTAWVITISYAVVAIIGVAVALIVFRTTRVGFKARPAGREVLEEREAKWGIVVVVFLVTVLGLTIFGTPYAKDDNESGEQRIAVTGQQFAWTVKPSRVRAGLRTVVILRATDVSHALGLYDPDNELVKQVNVVPDATQRFVVTFKKPGTWTMSCLEFCGANHHLMENTLEVTR